MTDYPIGYKDYKDEVIHLRRAISALKRGRPTDWDLQVLGCSSDDFSTCNEYLTAHSFGVKEREKFIKRCKEFGADLFDMHWLEQQNRVARINLGTDSKRSPYWEALEMITGNLLYNKYALNDSI